MDKNSLELVSVAAVIASTLFVGIRYTTLIIRQRIRPALAMWVFFFVAVAGSLATYLAEGDHGPWDNILNTADLLLVGWVAGVIWIFGDRSTRFTRFDLGCTGAVLVILGGWALTRSHLLANLAIQSILVIAYLPVVRRLSAARENTESFSAWIAMMVAPFFALLSSEGLLASVYAIRAIVCTSVLLALMTRTELRVRARARAGAEARTEL